MSANFLKIIKKSISNYLSYCFNRMICLGVYPNVLKKAIVYPIFKKGDPNKMENYRPISTLSNINKIFEYIIDSQIRQYLTLNNILSDRQFGFVKNSSPISAIFTLLNDIHLSFNSKSILVALFLDFRKAFDLLNIDLLLVKLKKYGFDLLSLSLLESYLKGRRFQVFLIVLFLQNLS